MKEGCPMSQAQAGIIREPSEHALFLVLRVEDRARKGRSVARVAAKAPSLTQKIARTDPRAKLVSTVSFGPELWDVISPGRRPQGFRQFQAIEAQGRRAPSTGGHILAHIISKRRDLCFELAMQLMKQLSGAVEVMEEVHGFRYLDSRDLTGFIDGTENPKGKGRAAAALIGAEDPYFTGGSFVFTQRYVHDLDRWARIVRREQEKVIGRRKSDSKELSERAKPPTAHIRRVVIEEDGEELQIVRHSFPYGTIGGEAGLFFISYSKNLDIPERMLRRMMGTTDDSLHDRLMEFSRAVSGANFFAPSLKVLRSL
jgi:putative iron-dependent peroxidase